MQANKTAFIFIEFQNDFCTEGGKLFAAVKDEIDRNQTIANAQRLLAGARELGCLIIHCPFVMNGEWIDAHACTGILAGIRENSIFAPNSWGQAIIDEMAPAAGEQVLQRKFGLSAFSHTNLQEILTEAGIENLVVCGFLTNVCAQATAYSAYDLGFTTRMAMDACGAMNESIQKYVEDNIAPVLGGESTVDDILASISVE